MHLFRERFFMNMKKILILLSTAFLLAGCNADYDGDNDLIFMWFEVSGRVVDGKGNPIKGIAVDAESAERCFTDADGKFLVKGGGLPAGSTTVKCSDVDKEDNGGYFNDKNAMVELVKVKDGQGWTEGYYEAKDVEIVLSVRVDNITGDQTSPEL